MTMDSVACGMCGTSVRGKYLERHLRRELQYSPWECGICGDAFFTYADARMHFDPKYGAHPPAHRKIMELLDPDAEDKVRALLGGRPVDAERPADGPCQRWVKKLKREEPGASEEESEPRPDSKLAALTTEDEEATEDEKKDAVIAPGHVPCSICGLGFAKREFNGHVMDKHMSSLPFLCRLCPFKTKTRQALKMHLKKTHEGAQLSPQTSTDLTKNLRPKIDAIVVQAFGDPKNHKNPIRKCNMCQMGVPDANRHAHVANKHVTEPIFTCLLCSKDIQQWSPYFVKQHLKNTHKRPMEDGLFESHKDGLVSTVEALVKELFD